MTEYLFDHDRLNGRFHRQPGEASLYQLFVSQLVLDECVAGSSQPINAIVACTVRLQVHQLPACHQANQGVLSHLVAQLQVHRQLTAQRVSIRGSRSLTSDARSTL
jgi:hypothetical protein